MKDNVTYLLGAGASFHALPIVSNWNDRLESFIQYLKNHKESFKDYKLTSKQVGLILSDIELFFSEAKKHATIDTYAKKLFLKNDKISQRKLISLKHFIGCFFSFEQTKKNHFVPQLQDSGEIVGLGDLYNGQKKQLDERYDPFFATLLNPNTKCLDERVNIVSWNYDFQIELAYSDFYKHLNPHEKLKTFPNAFESFLGGEGEFKIIKLNSTAGLARYVESNERNTQGLHGDYLFKLENGGLTYQNSNEFHVPTLEAMLTIYSNYLKGEGSLELSMSFAWEKSDTAEKRVKFAKDLMKTTKALVVIGYSFPNFNRDIDREILSSLPNGAKIYYQDLETKVDGLIQRLKGLLPIKSSPFKIEKYTDLDQFFIPYEL